MNNSENPSAASGTQPAVLIADNDPGVAALLVEILQHDGLTAVVVPDGVAVLAHLEETPVDLLVCDLDMPGMDGLTVLRELRQQRVPPPVIVITGYLNPEIERSLGELEFVRAVFEKPFDLFAFSTRARELLRNQVAPTARDGAPGDGQG
jgi:CheY-like chemotaxis protein